MRFRLNLQGSRTETYPSKSVSLKLHKGEILGLAGLVGAGRTELARAVFGIDRLLPARSGWTAKIAGQRTPREAIGNGIFLVPEDRKRCGLLLDVSIAENIALPDLDAYSSGGLVNDTGIATNAESAKRSLNIRAPSIERLPCRCPAATSKRSFWRNGFRCSRAS